MSGNYTTNTDLKIDDKTDWHGLQIRVNKELLHKK